MSDQGISLYFALREGRRADLEVVSEAALHWIAAIRAAASEIDPNVHIRVELIDADVGSLRLNTILDWVEEQLARAGPGL